jgi:transposase-like protein
MEETKLIVCPDCGGFDIEKAGLTLIKKQQKYTCLNTACGITFVIITKVEKKQPKKLKYRK